MLLGEYRLIKKRKQKKRKKKRKKYNRSFFTLGKLNKRECGSLTALTWKAVKGG